MSTRAVPFCLGTISKQAIDVAGFHPQVPQLFPLSLSLGPDETDNSAVIAPACEVP